MIYTLSTDFTKIAETSGTIQNASHINTIEMSNSSIKGSGFLLYPLQSKSFDNQTIYLRGVDGAAEARVIPFELDAGGGDSHNLANLFADVSLNNGVVSFLNSGGQVVKNFNLPEEIFLRSVGTSFVSNFTWSNVLYPNSTNPNLDGKPVLVLHIMGDSLNSPYEDWGFCNLEDLINLYVPADASIAITNNSISAGVSSVSGNQLIKDQYGLLVAPDDSKIDKVANASNGNIAIFDDNGNIADAGFSLADVGIPTSPDIANFRYVLAQAFGIYQGS